RAIGGGTQQALSGLAPGSYTLALTALNTSGKTATVTTTLTIAPLVIPQSAGVALDGTCDDAAYATAPQLPLAPYADGAQAFVRLVRGGDGLYACFVGMKRTGGTSPGTLAALRVDTNYSRDAQPQPGDYLFVLGEDGVIQTYNGTGSGYTTPGPSGASGQVSANATTWMAELRIDASVLGGWGRVVGLDVEQAWVNAVADDYFWPHRATWNNPGSWGAASLGDAPQISAVAPTSAPVGSGDTLVTVTGSGFAAGTVAQLNGTALATTVISDTQLQATIPAANLALAGTFSLAAVNPGMESAPSNALPFSVTNPLPRITQATLAGKTLTLTGSSFASGAMVQFNGTDYPAAGDGTQVRVIISDADLVGSAGAPVSVFNPQPGGGVSNVVTLGAGTAPGGGSSLYLPLVSRP
ncbi:MAG: IPT/TIG domain-containing protein, partial [Chloroflexales bacterium]|nr:IPT/TIG domain-containing protein [Chloroflexales bacterium]